MNDQPRHLPGGGLKELVDLVVDCLEIAPQQRPAWMAQHCLDPGLRARAEAILNNPELAGSQLGTYSDVIAALVQKAAAAHGLSRARSSDATAMPQVGDVLRAGERRWEITGISRGTLSCVYFGIDLNHDRTFAAKTYPGCFFDAIPGLIESVEQEGAVWYRMSPHPNIVTLDTVERIGGKPYLFMPYYNQGDLGSIIGTPRLSGQFPLILFYAMQICDGLSHAYEHGVLAHRDIKPANCFLSGPQGLAVADLGLAQPRWTGDDPSPGYGTPAYMPPEQWADKVRADVRSDIYALGATLYEMAAGHPVFGELSDLSRDSLQRLRSRHENSRVAPIASCPCSLNDVLQRCLAKKPLDRHSSVLELRADLERVFHEVTGSSAPGPSAPLLDATDRRVLLHQAAQEYELRHFEQALVKYDQVLKTHPEDVQALAGRAETLRAQGRAGAAASESRRVTRLEPESAEAWFLEGNASCDAGNYEHALTCYEQAARLAPDTSQHKYHYERGVTLGNLGRSDEEEIAYRRALECWPDHDMSLTNLGHLLRMRGDFEGAIPLLQRAVDANPEREEAWWNLGACLLAKGRLDEAEECLTRAIRIKPRDSMNWYYLALVLEKRTFWRRALMCHSAASRFRSECFDVATADRGASRCAQAIVNETASSTDDSYLIGLLQLITDDDQLRLFNGAYTTCTGTLYWLRDDVSKIAGQTSIVDLCRTAVDALPKGGWAFRRSLGEALEARARLYRQLGQIELCLADLDAIVDAADVDTEVRLDAMYNRAAVRRDMGDAKAASDELQRVLESPDVSDSLRADAIELRAMCLFDTGNFACAKHEFSALLRQDGIANDDRARLLCSRAGVLLLMEDLDEAEQDLSLAIRLPEVTEGNIERAHGLLKVLKSAKDEHHG